MFGKPSLVTRIAIGKAAGFAFGLIGFLTLLIHDHLREFSVSLFGPDSAFISPFWFVAEGAVVGLIISFAATHIGCEGWGRQTR